MFNGIKLDQLKAKYDVVVIGSGIGGLTCANYLARAGLSVLVIERHFLPGGYCTSFKRKGYTFDAAAHLFSSCGRYEPAGFILREMGLNLPFTKINPARFEFGGKKMRIFGSLDEFRDGLKLQFPGKGKELDRFFSDIIRLYRSALRNRNADKELIEIASITYDDFLNRYFDDAGIKAALSFFWLLLGDRPKKISSLAMIFLLGSYLIDSTSSAGLSAQELSNQFCEYLTKNNGSVLLSNQISKILIKNGKASGVVLADGREIKSDIVVSNADARQTFLELIEGGQIEPEYINKLLKMEIGEAPFELYLGVKYPGIREYEGVFFEEEDVNNPLGIFVFDNKESQDKNSLIISTVFPYKYEEVQDWKTCKKELEDLTIKKLEGIIPNLANSIEVVESATPYTYHRYTLNYKGSAYGFASTPDQFWGNRLDNETPIKNLYLTGHWTKPGAGILSVLFSGRMTAQKIKQDK